MVCLIVFLEMSYWDVLPVELQEYVLRLRDNQALIEHRESKRSRDLCDEIEWHGAVRERWGIGHIQVKPFRLRNGSLCTSIFAHYVDYQGRKQRVFLDFNLHCAYYMCNAVKWNMLKERMGVVPRGN